MLLVDPMVRFPEHPMLLPKLQMKENNGIVIYGSPDGPFKLNGKNAKTILLELIPHLTIKNTVKEIIEKCALKEATVVKTLEILFQKGCLVEYTELDGMGFIDKHFIHNISKNKNYSSLGDVYKRKKDVGIHLISFDPAITEKTRTILNKYGMQVNTKDPATEDDWYVYVTDREPDEAVYQLSLKNKVLFFMVNPGGIQIGPVFSQKTIRKEHYIQQSNLDSPSTEADTNYIANLLSMTIMREALSFGTGELATGRVTISNNETKLDQIQQINQESANGIIDQFEAEVKFPASEFINKSNHLSHYKPSNIQLGFKGYTSFLWKKVEAPNLDPNIIKFFHYTADFKVNRYKKYTPTGGNINANILFYINLCEAQLDGKGLYFYNNRDGHFYKINHVKEEDLEQVIDYDKPYRGFIVVGNDVDMIAGKYGPFAFKVGNLNCGVLLSQILSVNHLLDLQLDYLTGFEEEEMREMLGIKTTNEIINFIIGVE